MSALPPPPLHRLYLHLTEGCDQACRHCWLAPRHDPEGVHTEVLEVGRVEIALREARPLGLRGVKLTGGEPLLHPEILRLLDMVAREGLGLNLETNGQRLAGAVAERIARIQPRFVSVSLDGVDAATHDRVRGVEGAHERALQGIANLVAAGVRPQIVMSLLRENTAQVDAMVALAKRLGAQSVKFNLVQPTARGEALHRRDETPSIEALVALGRRVEGELQAQSALPLYFDYPLAFRPLSRLAAPDGRGVCHILNILGVLWSGHYALCGIGSSVRELIFGRVDEGGLEAIWREHPTLCELRTGMPARLEGICAACLMKHWCLGACVAQSYYRTGRLWSPFWFCAQAHEQGQFPASRVGKEGWGTGRFDILGARGEDVQSA